MPSSLHPDLGAGSSSTGPFRAGSLRVLQGLGLLVCLGLVALLASGCGVMGQQQDNPFTGGAGANQIQIEINNHNFNDATIHAVSSSGRSRLGMVTGKTTSTFRMEWSHSQRLQLEINLIGGDRCTTRPLDVDPGDHLELTIAVELRRSPSCR